MRLARTGRHARQQSVSTGVVAQFDGGFAHIGHRHSAFFQVLLGDGRVFQQVIGAISDQLVEASPAFIDAGQDAGGERCLECTAHDEALIGPPGYFRACPEVFHTKTYAAITGCSIVSYCGDRGWLGQRRRS